MGESTSLEDVTKDIVYRWGKASGYPEIYHVFQERGILDEDGSLADRVAELIERCEVRIKVRL